MGRLSSPRFVNRLLWISSLILFAGIIGFAVVKFGANKTTTPSEAAGEAPAAAAVADTTPKKTVPLDPKVRLTAGRFILSAVTREDLAEGWTLMHPEFKAACACTRGEWMTGNIPVVPYPSRALDDASFAVTESYANEVVLQVALLPKEGAGVDGQVFWLGMKKDDGRWLVTEWSPYVTTPVHVPE